MDLVWCEVDSEALAANLRAFRRLTGPGVLLCPAVKANAYGHGLLVAARAFLAGGADWLCVNALYELRALREAGLTCPIYLMGYVGLEDLEEAVQLNCRLVTYNREAIERLGTIVARTGLKARVHIKLETGNNRQGVPAEEALELADLCVKSGVELEGAATHFANVEDTTDHSYAREQLARFLAATDALRRAGHLLPIRHLANSAATLLWPEAQLELARLGIAAYGMWPSRETYVSYMLERRERVTLTTGLSWKTRIAQIKNVPVGEYIGYGCTYMTTHPTRLAILPVGYYDGYDRTLSNLGYVLVRGMRAPIRGRVCMNITMVDVTDIPDAALEDEVVLLGAQGGERITAELLAEWAGTINYEVVARIADHVPRKPLGQT